MASPVYYRTQAQRCLLLSRATLDTSARAWLTDMASYYVAKARGSAEEDAAPPANGSSLLSPPSQAV
jgi:hypothetical protein